jgi:hypothetical protein
MRKLLNRKIVEQSRSAPSARKPSPTTTTSFQIISIPEVWEDHGETIILTISRRFIGGARERRHQAGYRE